MNARLILETPRLILREMTPDDFPALCAMLRDPEVMYAYAHAFSEAEARQWLDRQLQRYREDGFGLWAVTLKTEGGLPGEMIGQCGLTRQDCPPVSRERVLEVGYLFRKSRWHQGYATEAAKAMIDFAYQEFDIHDFGANHAVANPASGKVMEKCGMHFDHYGEYSRFDGSETFPAKFYKLHLD